MTMLTRLHSWGAPYLRLVLWAVRHLHPLTQARALSFIHFAHFSVLDGLAPQSTSDGERRDPYLLFVSNFNGAWEEYIEAFCQVIKLDINALMACCEGFPGLVPARAFRTFMSNHEFVAEHYYSAYPKASATLIRAAGELAGDFARLSALATTGDDRAFARVWYQLLTLPRVQANLAGQACTRPGFVDYLHRVVSAKNNVAGNTYAFVALTPLEHGRAEQVRSYLLSLPPDEYSPLAGVPGTHFARWVVLDRVYHDSWPEQLELIQPAYLLFTAVFDITSRTALASYLETLLAHLGHHADAIWAACPDWPGNKDRPACRAFLSDHQHDAQFLFAGYPGQVSDIRRNLRNRELLVSFAQQAQTLPPDQLRAVFLDALTTHPDRSPRGGEKQ
jgi:hypothetical protein